MTRPGLPDAQSVIERLGLVPHPEEGGYFRETYRSGSRVESDPRYAGPRAAGTAIYYLLTPSTLSELHRLPGAEIFHFYLGDPVEMLMLYPDGVSEIIVMGPDLETMTVQHLVPGGVWQGSRLVEGGRWALLGTTMSPGFDFADYERGQVEALSAAYPDRRRMISALLPPRSRGSVP